MRSLFVVAALVATFAPLNPAVSEAFLTVGPAVDGGAEIATRGSGCRPSLAAMEASTGYGFDCDP